jgi:hypothetical protein
MLSLVPSFQLDEMKIEAIFVVDRSGSMQGPGIVEAKRALKVNTEKFALYYHLLIGI